MPNPFGAPEITSRELERLRQEGAGPIVLDVREAYELGLARLKDRFEHVPMSQLADRGISALPAAMSDKAARVVVLCHHGIRSAQVTNWLLSLGWTDVRSLEGGIDAWALLVDPSVGAY